MVMMDMRFKALHQNNGNGLPNAARRAAFENHSYDSFGLAWTSLYLFAAGSSAVHDHSKPFVLTEMLLQYSIIPFPYYICRQ